MLENIGMDYFRAVPREKMCGSKYHGPGAGAPGTLEKVFRMEQHKNSPSLFSSMLDPFLTLVSRDFDPFSKYSVVNSYSNPLK